MKAIRLALCASILAMASPALAHDDKPKSVLPAAIKPVVKPLTTAVVQHSGGTDASGCHKNHATGDYHCHNPR